MNISRLALNGELYGAEAWAATRGQEHDYEDADMDVRSDKEG